MILNDLPDEKDSSEVMPEIMAEVKKYFRPEFINRLDEIILFHRLRFEHMDKIIDIQMGLLQEKLLDRKITIELDKKAKELIAISGYDTKFGARPLKRVVQRKIKNPLATLI